MGGGVQTKQHKEVDKLCFGIMIYNVTQLPSN